MTKSKVNDKSKASTNTKKESLSGDHFTLSQVAIECGHVQTEREELNDKVGTISDHFMDAALMYIKEAPTGEMAKDHPFLVACKAQEEFSKSNEAGINKWDKVPASWMQMKSNIKQSYNKGIDINACSSESEMRAKLNEARKAEKDAAADNGEQVDQALQDAVQAVTPEISLRLFALVNQCKDMTEAQDTEAARILDEALENIITMKEIAELFAADQDLDEALEAIA